MNGMLYNVFTKLYDSLVQPVISYSAPIWGYKTLSCIDAIQNRAMRSFLSTNKYTPTPAVIGNLGWFPGTVTQWKRIANFWYRCHVSQNSDFTNRICQWTLQLS